MEKNSCFKSIFAFSTCMRVAWRLLLGCFTVLLFLFTIIIIYMIVYEIIYKEWIYPNLPEENGMEIRMDASPRDSLVAFEQGGKWGYLNQLTGETLLERYDYGWSFSEGLAAVIKDSRLMFINSLGEVMINAESGWVSKDSECKFIQGYCVVNSLEGLAGLIDKQGKWALQPIYDEINQTNGLWKVKSDGLYGLFSSRLDTLFEVKHPRIDIENEAIEVSFKNHEVKRYDYEGNVLEDFVIHAIDDMLYRKTDGEDEHCHGIADQMFYAVYVTDESDLFYGLMDRKGKRITPPDYTSIQAIGKDLYFCKPQGIVINAKGIRIE